MCYTNHVNHAKDDRIMQSNTNTNRVHQVIDTVANGTKTVFDAYHGAFFSPEAQQRYDTAGVFIGGKVVQVLERFQATKEEEG